MAHHDHHEHSHHHGHAHHHGGTPQGSAFMVGMLLNLVFVVVEFTAGLSANSLALLSDAGHNVSDVIGLALAWGAHHLTQRAPTERHTYGLRRSSILAALLNATLLLIAVGGIVWEAAHRLNVPQAIASDTIMWVASAGVVVNTLSALLFVKGQHDLNVRGAFLHLAADAAISAGVVLTGVIIRYTDWLWLDPAVSIAISLAIAIGTWQLFQESLDLAMDAVPAHIDPQSVMDFLRELPGVSEVHDLHIWGMSTTETALTVHLVSEGANTDNSFLHAVTEELRSRYGIAHCTIQIERPDPERPCPLAPGDIV